MKHSSNKSEIIFHSIKNQNIAKDIVKIILVLSFVSIFLIPVGASAVSVDIDFYFTSPGFSPIITVLDDSADKTDLPDKVNVIITSNAERNNRISLELLETDNHSGEFKNTGLVLMDDDNLFPQDRTITIIYDDPDRDTETVSVIVLSFFPPDFSAFLTERDVIELILTRTTPGHYEGRLKLTSTGSTTDTDLEALAGDVIELQFPCGKISDGLVTPNPDPTVRAIRVAEDVNGFVDDVLTVTYDNGVDVDIKYLDVAPGAECGGSGGGLVITRIVLDLLGGISGGDFAPPQLTISKLNLQNLPLVGDMLDFILNANPFTVITPLDDPSIDYPVSINGNGYLLTQHANTIQTYTGKTGEPVSFKMTLFDATGIEHIALYTNLRGDQREIQDSDTFVIYHEDKPLEITDPRGFFSSVNFTESEYNGKYIANFDMTFAKPMDTSDVIIRTWDELRNSGDIKIFDAIKIEGESIVNPDTNNLIVPDSAEIVIPYYKMPFYEIPNADSNGNLIYYNSFGNKEEKQVHPYYSPTIYPDYIGRAERHDDGFYGSIINENLRAQIVAKELVGSSFITPENTQDGIKFFYPNNVGKLDRENKDVLKSVMLKEYDRALKISGKKYHANQLDD